MAVKRVCDRKNLIQRDRTKFAYNRRRKIIERIFFQKVRERISNITHLECFEQQPTCADASLFTGNDLLLFEKSSASHSPRPMKNTDWDFSERLCKLFALALCSYQTLSGCLEVIIFCPFR